MIRLHHTPQTRSMRSLWLLHELGVDFEVMEHAFGKNLRSDAFLSLNPAGRVPALEIDGEVMFETGAITEYLCEQFPGPMGRTPDDPERRDWLVWVHFAETISQHAAALTQQHVVLYEDHMRSPTVMKLEAARLGKCYAALDGRLSGRDFLLDGGFSAADVSCGQAVYMAIYFKRLDGYSNVSAWYDRITARPGFRHAMPDNPVFYTQDFYAVPE